MVIDILTDKTLYCVPIKKKYFGETLTNQTVDLTFTWALYIVLYNSNFCQSLTKLIFIVPSINTLVQNPDSTYISTNYKCTACKAPHT